jgi:hypothetical protein
LKKKLSKLRFIFKKVNLISEPMVTLPFLKKKKEGETFPGKGFIPVDRVREMSSRGFSEPEIIDVLRREGFSPDEIDKALTQALRIRVTGAPEKEEIELPTLEEITKEAPKEEVKMPEMPETSLPESYSEGLTEEYVDYIVQTRVSEIVDRVNDISLKYKELEKRIEFLQSQVNDILKTRSDEQKQILQKIDSFNETVNDVNVRIGGLEKAFKETLPALIESVRALSDLVQRLKKET